MAFRFNKAINKLKNNMTVSGTGLGRVLKACMFALVIATVCSTYSPVYAANAAGVVIRTF